MVYLHEASVNERLIRHWANETESADDTTATYKIRQIETGVVYDDAVDVIPCRYTYEAMDEPIEQTEEATEQDYVDALAQFGAETEE